MDSDEEVPVEERIEQGAYALAQLIYDIYREKQRGDNDIDITKRGTKNTRQRSER